MGPMKYFIALSFNYILLVGRSGCSCESKSCWMCHRSSPLLTVTTIYPSMTPHPAGEHVLPAVCIYHPSLIFTCSSHSSAATHVPTCRAEAAISHKSLYKLSVFLSIDESASKVPPHMLQ